MKIRMQAAVAVSTLASVSTAFAGLDGLYDDQMIFEGNALALGKVLKGTIDFENYQGPDFIGFGDLQVGGSNDDIFGPGGELLFAGGFGTDNIVFSTNFAGPVSFLAITPAGGAGLNSTVFGSNTFSANLMMGFSDLKTAVGFDLVDWAGATGFTEIVVTDGAGNVSSYGVDSGTFVGIIDSDGIASIDLVSPGNLELVDNIQLWNIPGPGALALFGLGGLVGRRRRG